MRGVRDDLKKLSDGNEQRLKGLEVGKLDRTEANRLQSESLAAHADFEKRIRLLEDDSKVAKAQLRTWLAVGGSILAVAQVLVQVVLNYFFK